MITFLAEPNYIEPVYGNLVFQFESTGATDPSKYKYRYVVDVFSNEGFITTLKISPSTEGWGQTDLSPILMNYTSSQPLNVGCSGETPIHQIAWGYLNDNMIVYSIKVGEEYSTTPNGNVVVYDGLGNVGSPGVLSQISYAYNGVKEWFNGQQFNFEPFYLTGQTGNFPQYSSMFMTNSPRTRYIRSTDNAVLGAFNWQSASPPSPSPVDVSKQIYSALFTFYDIDNVVIQTSRSYNVEDLCGTRPNCAWYDGWFDLPTNFAEQQVVYLGVGIPNLEDYHGINVPSNTKYYKVELEAITTSPTPPDPSIEDFDGCSCHTYTYTNPSDEAEISFTYLDCVGAEQTITISPSSTGEWCACQNTNIASVEGETATDNGECEVCECKTYDVYDSGFTGPSIFTYTNCSGDTISGSVDLGGTTRVCACEDSVSAPGLETTLIGDCPIPFSADCRSYGVSYSASTPYTYTFTGCCGTQQTALIPPSTSLILKINYPAPTPAGITATLLGSTSPDPCPDPLPNTGTTYSGGTQIIGRNVCDDTLQYFTYYGDPIFLGVFFNFQETIYEFIEVGGGGFIDLVNPYIFTTQAQALSAFPCPTYASGTCFSGLTKISEPFYFYLDEVCSQGDRNLFFMNKMGAWDYYNFRAKEDVGYSVNKQEYQAAPLLYSQGWDTTSYYGWASKRNVWSNNVVKAGVLYTAPLPQAESIWLSEELFQSPSVYLIGDNGVLEPIVITNTEVSVPNYQINSNLYQISIEYKSAYDTTRQQQE